MQSENSRRNKACFPAASFLAAWLARLLLLFPKKYFVFFRNLKCGSIFTTAATHEIFFCSAKRKFVNIMKPFSCTLTGHRELPADFDNKILYNTLESLLLEGCDTFFCGMAEGFDLLSLGLLLELKDRYHFTVEACVPFRGQEKNFSPRNRELYFDYLQKCDKITVLSDTYKKGIFLARDRYMVDECDVVLAYLTKQSGGTYYTVNYAKSRGKEVRYVPLSV